MTNISHVVWSFFSPLPGEKIACIMEHFALAEFYFLIVAFSFFFFFKPVPCVYLKIGKLCLVLLAEVGDTCADPELLQELILG